MIGVWPMKLGFKYLESLIEDKEIKQNELSDNLGITPQNLTKWRETNNIPPRHVSGIAAFFNLNSIQIDLLMGLRPLEFQFRTKGGVEFLSQNAPQPLNARVQFIHEKCIEPLAQKANHELLQVFKNELVKAGKDYFKIASLIRKRFEIPGYMPIAYINFLAILRKIGVNFFYLPFGTLQLTAPDSTKVPTGILYKKDGTYTILIDGDRRMDESHFDSIHELIHVFFDGIFEDSKETEDLIDLVSGELIYPRQWIVDTFFDGDENSRPGTNLDAVWRTFSEQSDTSGYIISPKGLAKAMHTSKLQTDQSQLYKSLYSDFHENFKKSGPPSFSEMGGMNIDFSDRSKVEHFYKNLKNKRPFTFPVFELLKYNLVSSNIGPSDFANIFGLSTADAVVLKSIFANESSVKTVG